jgi:thiol-disulfide isomerase/thioredoxin
MSTLFDPPVNVLNVDDQEGTASTLHTFRAGKPLVLDFWHTKCVKCPAAISHLDEVAPKHPGVTFAACALSLGSETEGTQDQVLELLEGQWENLQHLYMNFDDKEAAKKEYDFKLLPFTVVFSAEGSVLFKGNPMDIDFATVFDAKPTAAAAEAEALAENLASSAKVSDGASAAASKPLAEANRDGAALGFGGDDDDF